MKYDDVYYIQVGYVMMMSEMKSDQS